MSDKKKILIIQPIHKAGIDLIKNNTNYDYEIIENIDNKDIKKKFWSVMVYQLEQQIYLAN